MGCRKAIQKTFMTDRLVAGTITRHLVEHFLESCSQPVSDEGGRVALELIRLQRRRQRCGRWMVMIACRVGRLRCLSHCRSVRQGNGGYSCEDGKGQKDVPLYRASCKLARIRWNGTRFKSEGPPVPW